jgi:hypothetical protein
VSEREEAAPLSAGRAALLRKYQLLCSWRTGKDTSFAGGGEREVASRAAMRELAEEFPGALRELDLLGLPELERRVAVLARAENPREPWIDWILSYHELMREVLVQRRGPVRQARPPAGRISLAVLAEVARRFGVPETEVAATLFPSRRPPPPAP